MATINHIKTSTVSSNANPTNTYLMNPADWNSVHNYTLQDGISLSAGNTAGASALISSGTCYLAGGNNIFLSQAGTNAITISGQNQGVLSQWPEHLPASTAVSTYFNCSTRTTNATSEFGYTMSIFLAPMVFQQSVAFSIVRLPISWASVAGTGTVTQVYSIGFYSNNASTLSLINAVYGGLYITQNSVTAVTYSVWTATTGSNTFYGSASCGFGGLNAASISSSGGNISSFMQGMHNLALPLATATTFAPGNYWCAYAQFTGSTSSAVWTIAGVIQSNAISSACILDLGVNTASTLASLYGWGVISTTFTSVSNAATWFPLPSSIGVSNMNTTNSSGQRFHVPILTGSLRAPSLTKYSLGGVGVYCLCVGSDGNIWAASSGSSTVLKITTAGVVTPYTLTGAATHGICSGSDGNLWVTDINSAVWKVVVGTGVGTKYTLTNSVTTPQPLNICSGSDGNLWVADDATGSVWKITTAGVATQYSLSGATPFGICAGT